MNWQRGWPKIQGFYWMRFPNNPQDIFLHLFPAMPNGFSPLDIPEIIGPMHIPIPSDVKRIEESNWLLSLLADVPQLVCDLSYKE